MDLGDGLAIWGAITGTIGAFVAVANMRRDRPSLRVSRYISINTYKSRGSPVLVVQVTNVGKQPIAIGDIALATQWRRIGRLRKTTIPEKSIMLPWRQELDKGSIADSGVDPMFVRPVIHTMKPGDAITFSTPISEHLDLDPVRPYAVDVLGRISWAPEVTTDEQRRAVERNAQNRAYYG